MLFCPSFTQFERFLQTDQLIIRLQVVVVTNFIRMLMRNVFVNVFKSDAVIWWAAIFCRGAERKGEGERGGGGREGGGGGVCVCPKHRGTEWGLRLLLISSTTDREIVPA